MWMLVPLKIQVIVGKVGNSLRITLPTAIVKQLNIVKGDALDLTLDEDDRIIAVKS